MPPAGGMAPPGPVLYDALEGEPVYVDGGYVDPSLEMSHIRRRVFGVDEEGFLYPTWYVQLDAMWLDRSDARNARLLEDENGPGAPGQQPTLLETDDLEYDTAWGPRISLGCRLDDCRHVELTYFGLNHWTAEQGVVSTAVPFNLTLPFQSQVDSNFDGAERFRASNASDLHSLELNCFVEPCGCHCCVLPFCGIRYFNFHDELNLSIVEGNNREGRYDIDADNHLIGYQVGGIIDRAVTHRFSWNVVGKVGGYLNLSRQSTLLSADDGATVYRDVTDHEEDLAFLGEVGVNLVYQVSRHVSLTAGYQVLWVDGIALAPEQLDYRTGPDAGTRVDHNGDLFFNGGYVGIRITN